MLSRFGPDRDRVSRNEPRAEGIPMLSQRILPAHDRGADLQAEGEARHGQGVLAEDDEEAQEGGGRRQRARLQRGERRPSRGNLRT